MNNVLGTRCLVCGDQRSFGLDATICPRCQGNLELVYDLERASEQLTRERTEGHGPWDLWRYAPILPVDPGLEPPPLAVGWTPLLPAYWLGRQLGVGRLLVKDEGRNPSGSLKDRASALVLMGALASDAPAVVGASTGNAGSSMACLAAAAGLPCFILVPADAPKAKLTQAMVFGARLIPVDGSYDQAFDLSLELSHHTGWFSRSTGFNPLTREGKKTCALEIWEQLGYRVPDWVFVSVGDGNIISGLHKGFRDLRGMGLIERLPRICAVQSEGSAAVAQAVAALGEGAITPPGEIEVAAVEADTRADSISVDLPRDGVAAVRAVQESGGAALQVPDEQILGAIPMLGSATGVFGEPAGAASVAGLITAANEGLVGKDDTVVCVITGNGLKDVDGALETVQVPEPVKPSIGAVLGRLGIGDGRD